MEEKRNLARRVPVLRHLRKERKEKRQKWAL